MNAVAIATNPSSRKDNTSLTSKIRTQNPDLYAQLCRKEATIALVGLGYVGLPIALEFAKEFKVIGYDINKSRVDLMKQGIDPSGELVAEDFEDRDIFFTSCSVALDKAQVIIVAVPTPVGADKAPDLKPLSSACHAVGVSLAKGKLVVFESTVYPGCTEEVCLPILEEVSGLKCNEDFWIGYSPERINPGDKVHTLTNITKVVSGSDAYAEEQVAAIYNHIIDAGVHIAPSLSVAEAAKIVENTQRDVNIALMNELSHFFAQLGINTHDVLAAAGTKWNFLNFYPGLVGGHCIGVDPYYLIHKAEQIGTSLDVIGASRATNDAMPAKVVAQMGAALEEVGVKLVDAKVLVLGATFKENVTDLRNSKAAEMCQQLNRVCRQLDIVDPHADADQMLSYYGLHIKEQMSDGYDAVVYAVNHEAFADLDWERIDDLMSGSGVVYDFKRVLGQPAPAIDMTYLTL